MNRRHVHLRVSWTSTNSKQKHGDVHLYDWVIGFQVSGGSGKSGKSANFLPFFDYRIFFTFFTCPKSASLSKRAGLPCAVNRILRGVGLRAKRFLHFLHFLPFLPFLPFLHLPVFFSLGTQPRARSRTPEPSSWPSLLQLGPFIWGDGAALWPERRGRAGGGWQHMDVPWFGLARRISAASSC